MLLPKPQGSPAVGCLPEESHCGWCPSSRNAGSELKARSSHSWGPPTSPPNSVCPPYRSAQSRTGNPWEANICTVHSTHLAGVPALLGPSCSEKKTVSLSSEPCAGCTCRFCAGCLGSQHPLSGNIKVINALSRWCEQLPPLLRSVSGLAVDGNACRWEENKGNHLYFWKKKKNVLFFF